MPVADARSSWIPFRGLDRFGGIGIGFDKKTFLFSLGLILSRMHAVRLELELVNVLFMPHLWQPRSTYLTSPQISFVVSSRIQ